MNNSVGEEDSVAVITSDSYTEAALLNSLSTFELRIKAATIVGVEVSRRMSIPDMISAILAFNLVSTKPSK